MIDLTIAVPVIIAIIQGLKGSGMDKKYSFFASLILGIGGFYLFGIGDVLPRIFEGLIAALSASGLYSGVKNTVQ